MNAEDKRVVERINSMPERILAVDFDNTLSEMSEWRGCHHFGEPNLDMVELLRREKKQGTYIIIHTCRSTTVDRSIYDESIQALTGWLDENSIPYDEVWKERGKPFAHFYIDDRAVRVGCLSCMEKLDGRDDEAGSN